MLCCAVKVLEKRSVSSSVHYDFSSPTVLQSPSLYNCNATSEAIQFVLFKCFELLDTCIFFFCSSYSSDVKLLSRPGHLENRTKLRSLKKPFRREAKSLQLTKTSSVDLSLTFKNCMTPSIETRPCNCEPSVISSGRSFTATRDFVGIRSCD